MELGQDWVDSQIPSLGSDGHTGVCGRGGSEGAVRYPGVPHCRERPEGVVEDPGVPSRGGGTAGMGKEGDKRIQWEILGCPAAGGCQAVWGAAATLTYLEPTPSSDQTRAN